MNSPSIFIVEDEIITAKSIAKNILKFGYQLSGIATSGSEAILQILKTKPDLVLIDIFLDKSGIDGIAVAQSIQSHLEVPILYLTAHSDRATLERAKVTTPFGYILKPYSSKNLQISIEIALHKHMQDRQIVKREKILTAIVNGTQDNVIAADTKNRVTDRNLTSDINNSQASLAGDSRFQDLGNYVKNLVLSELPTPLAVILSTAQSLEDYRQKWSIEKQDKGLRRIQQAVGQIKGLLDNVTIWEELENNESILNPELIDLAILSQNIIDDLKLADGFEHQLSLSTQGNSRMVWLDKSVLRCIILNLLLNSLKYSPAGTIVSLCLKFRYNLVIIQVSDRGIGIPFKEQRQIFKPLYRASNARNIKGAGLGLAIVKAYVQLWGGNISLSSEPQSETIFTVNLPLKE